MPRHEPPEMELAEDADGPTNANTRHGRLSLDHDERYIFRFGDHQAEAVIFDNYRFNENVSCQEWIREVQREDRLLSRGGGGKGSASGARKKSIVGFACRRHVEEYRRFMSPRQRENSRAGVLPPVSIIAICYGGTHCAAVLLPDCSARYRYSSSERNPLSSAIKAFLTDPRLSFAGHNITREAASLREDWDLPLANPVELKTLVSKAFREEWLRGDFGRNGKIKLEAMASGVLGGLVVEEEPQRLKNDRYNHYEEELLMYVIRDAFLAYEIAVKCEDMIVKEEKEKVKKHAKER